MTDRTEEYLALAEKNIGYGARYLARVTYQSKEDCRQDIIEHLLSHVIPRIDTAKGEPTHLMSVAINNFKYNVHRAHLDANAREQVGLPVLRNVDNFYEDTDDRPEGDQLWCNKEHEALKNLCRRNGVKYRAKKLTDTIIDLLALEEYATEGDKELMLQWAENIKAHGLKTTLKQKGRKVHCNDVKWIENYFLDGYETAEDMRSKMLSDGYKASFFTATRHKTMKQRISQLKRKHGHSNVYASDMIQRIYNEDGIDTPMEMRQALLDIGLSPSFDWITKALHKAIAKAN